jgi:hypothetical protein
MTSVAELPLLQAKLYARCTQIVSDLVRPVNTSQILGLALAVQLHPGLATALSYATSKQNQSERMGYRSEQHFWQQVASLVLELAADVQGLSSGESHRQRVGNKLAVDCARHLMAGNTMRAGMFEDAAHSTARRDGARSDRRPLAGVHP